MSKDEKSVQKNADVKTQYCNKDNCHYDCETKRPNVCDVVISKLL